MRITLWLLGPMAYCILLDKHTRWHMQDLKWDLKSQWAQDQGNLSDQVQILEDTATVSSASAVVVAEPRLSQRQTPLRTPPRTDSGDRYIASGLERSLGRGGYQRPLVFGGDSATHQSVGAMGIRLR